MNTDDLIKSISADQAEAMPMGRAWMVALAIAVVLAAAVFFMLLGPRADMPEAMETVRFVFKFVVTLTLAVTAWLAARSLALPGQPARPAMLWLLAAPVLLGAAVFLEMLAIPAGERMDRMMGTNNMLCLLAIPAIGLPPLAALLAAMRHGAPTSPGMAGAIAGVLAGGIAATFYAAHCIDDSPLFVVLWYTLAIAILAAIGALSGRLFVRW